MSDIPKPTPAVDPLQIAAYGLRRIVEEIDGAMNHGTWRDEHGVRLKDTPEWVALYNAIRTLPPAQQDGEREKLGRFGWHPDPVIDFEIEIEKLESRWHGAVHGLSKPGDLPETKEAVAEAVTRAMEFRAGGREDGVIAKNRLRELDALARAALTAQPVAQEPQALPAETAPKDGRLLRLLVDYRGEEGGGPLEDAHQAWTIGFNNLRDTGDDEWQMAGWNWSHDHFTEGHGEVIGWLPFHADTSADARAVALWRLLDDIDTQDDASKWDDKHFRDAARKIQQRRFSILSGEEFDALSHGIARNGAHPATPAPVEAGWMDLEDAPDPKDGPFLVSNNPDAVNSHGRPSHVWCVDSIHKSANGECVAFTDADRKIHDLKVFRPVPSLRAQSAPVGGEPEPRQTIEALTQSQTFWYSSNDEECWQGGPYDTREEAEGEAKASEHRLIVEATKTPIRVSLHFDQASFIEQAEESLYDMANEDGDPLLDFLPAVNLDLQARVRAAIDDWQVAHQLSPVAWRFDWSGPVEVAAWAATESAPVGGEVKG